IDTESDDLVLGFAGGLVETSNPVISLTEFINNAVINQHVFDVGEDTAPSSPSTTVDMTGEYYSWIAAISLKAAAETELAVDDIVQLQALDAPALTQTHVLAPGGLVQSQVFGAPGLTQDHQLSPADLAQGQI